MTTSNSNIDERPISPVRESSHADLEKHLSSRPDPQELVDKHILLSATAAPALQQAQHELARQRATDSLKKGLEKRPERADLVERNILPESTASPSIVGPQKELEKHMRADSLNEKIAHRPSPSELVKEGILDEDPTVEQAKRDAQYEERIEEEYAKREGGA